MRRPSLFQQVIALELLLSRFINENPEERLKLNRSECERAWKEFITEDKRPVNKHMTDDGTFYVWSTKSTTFKKRFKPEKPLPNRQLDLS